MAKTIFLLIAMLIAAVIPASAQQPHGYGYAFVGPVVVPQSAFTRWNGDFINVGGGGESRLASRFGLGGEAGAILPVNNQYALTTGLASVSPAFHFISRNSKGKSDPFVDGGLSLLFARGGGVALHYGAGVNYWVRRRVGLRFEFRHDIWSPDSGETVNLVGFRTGIIFAGR